MGLAAGNQFVEFICNYATKGELPVCQVLILSLLFHRDNQTSPSNTVREVL